MVNTWQWTHSGLVNKGRRFFFVIFKVGELFFIFCARGVSGLAVSFWSYSGFFHFAMESFMLTPKRLNFIQATETKEGWLQQLVMLKVAKRGEGGWVGIYANWTGMLAEFSPLNQRELHSKSLFLPFLCPRSEKIGGLSEEYRMSSSDRSIFSSIHKRTLFRQLASVLDFKFSESCNLIN